MTRSCPRSAFSSDDLPTFGRPTIAIRGTRSVSSSMKIASSVDETSSASSCASAIASAWRSRSFRDSSSSDSGGQRPDERIEEVAGAAAVERAERVDLLPAELVELRALELAALVVGLVDRDDDRSLRRAQRLGRLLVGGRQARGRVDDEEDDVRFLDREARLLLDLLLDDVARVDLHPAGVDDDEAAVVPLGHRVEPVAGRAGAVLDDGLPLARRCG